MASESLSFVTLTPKAEPILLLFNGFRRLKRSTKRPHLSILSAVFSLIFDLNLSFKSNNWKVLYNAVLENACSEQGARMSAMDSSSKNAGEVLDRLTLITGSISLIA
ncbi:uncharacterized protein [Spinacia oleracea]|uniref:Uncharacterized protein n=1 Tax=Spinacia oleracea TaxID=3562 RepID=A0A9R0JHL0_SPIOL|nr:uncharacterized protein LOC110774962 [Spinacia oleracea]